MNAQRLNTPGPKYPDGRPMGHRCNSGCRTPKENSKESHCGACHNSFSAIGYFDQHRAEGYCLNPSGLGLELESGLWASAEGHTKRREVAERLAAGRSAAKGGD